jgi:hypothetical protein
MNATSSAHFDRQYQAHLKHLRLKGLQPKTIDAYARAIRRIGDYFGHQIDALSESQLTDYFRGTGDRSIAPMAVFFAGNLAGILAGQISGVGIYQIGRLHWDRLGISWPCDQRKAVRKRGRTK